MTTLTRMDRLRRDVVFQLAALVDGGEPSVLGAVLARIREARRADRVEWYRLSRDERLGLVGYLDGVSIADIAAAHEMAFGRVGARLAAAIGRLDAWLCGAGATDDEIAWGVVQHAEKNRREDLAAAVGGFGVAEQRLIREVLQGGADPDVPARVVIRDLARRLRGDAKGGDGRAGEPRAAADDEFGRSYGPAASPDDAGRGDA